MACTVWASSSSMKGNISLVTGVPRLLGLGLERRFSVFFVAQFGDNDELATQVLASQTHDPEYRVRKEVLDQRIRRIMGS